MNYYFCALLLVPFLFISGCSSSPEGVKVNTGSISARTFSFVKPNPRSLDGTDNRAHVHRMIQDAIAQNLNAKGVTRASSGGDLTVAYLVIRGNSVSTEVISDHFGHSGDTEKLADKAHDAYTGSNSRSYFESGTLLIDIVDTKTNKLLKRGYASSPLLKNLPASDRHAAVQEVVDTILSDLRLSH